MRKLRKTVRLTAALAVAAALAMLVLSGCGGAKGQADGSAADGAESETGYRIDFCGQEGQYSGAKESYLEGETVTLYYGDIENYTDYDFILDGESIIYDYDGEKGFVVTFEMPAHDVTLECKITDFSSSRPAITPDVLLIGYRRGDTATEGGEEYYELTLSTYSYDAHKLCVKMKSSDSEEEKIVEYLVPTYSSERCYRAIYETELNTWDEKECTESADGALVEVEYRYGNGYVTASSERMPYDGLYALEAVRTVLEGYALDEYLADAD